MWGPGVWCVIPAWVRRQSQGRAPGAGRGGSRIALPNSLRAYTSFCFENPNGTCHWTCIPEKRDGHVKTSRDWRDAATSQGVLEHQKLEEARMESPLLPLE